jgi:hypothetical protein
VEDVKQNIEKQYNKLLQGGNIMFLSASQVVLFHKQTEIQAEYADKAKQCVLSTTAKQPISASSKPSRWMGNFLLRTGRSMRQYVTE